jgi:hypothetical protein
VKLLVDGRLHRNDIGTRWRRLPVGRQALLVMAHLRKGATYADLACGFAVGTSTVFYRYLREALDLLATLAPTLDEAIEVARGKAYVEITSSTSRVEGHADSRCTQGVRRRTLSYGPVPLEVASLNRDRRPSTDGEHHHRWLHTPPPDPARGVRLLRPGCRTG